MLHRRTRTVLHYDVAVSATPSVAPAMQLLPIMQMLKQLAAKQDGVWLHNRGQAAVRISRVALDNQGSRAAILFQHANKDTADPSFSKLATGQIRTEPKLQGEGVAVSAHALIELSQSEKQPGVYRVLLEQVPGLSRTYIQNALNHLLRSYGQYSFVDLNGTARTAKPHLEFLPRLSECFLAELAKGKLSNITLIKRENASDLFDSDPVVKVREATLKIVPMEKTSGASAVDVVRRVIKAGRSNGFANARIHYQDDQGKPKSPEFPIQAADTFDALVAKSSILSVDADLSQCEADIRADVTQRMNALLEDPPLSLAA